MSGHPFEYHKPTEPQAEMMKHFNDLLKNVYEDLVQDVPNGRERALAITNLQQARMWINAAILELDNA